MEGFLARQPRYYFDVTALCFAAMVWLGTIKDKERRERLEDHFYQDIFRLYAQLRRQFHQEVSEHNEAPALNWAAEVDGGSLDIYNGMRQWLEKEGFDLEKLQRAPPLGTPSIYTH